MSPDRVQEDGKKKLQMDAAKQVVEVLVVQVLVATAATSVMRQTQTVHLNRL